MYATLESAEKAIEQVATSVGERKLDVVKIVAEIREDDLWKDALNPDTNKKYTKFDDWLNAKSEWFQRNAGMGPRQILRTLKAYLVFTIALDTPEELILRAGEHALLLAQVANTGRNLELRDDDAPTKTGGTYLGRESLKQHFMELMSQLDTNKAWKIKNTTQMIAAIMGKIETPKKEWYIEASLDDTNPTNKRVHITQMTFIYDGQPTEMLVPAPWSWDAFQNFVKVEHASVKGIDMPKDKI